MGTKAIRLEKAWNIQRETLSVVLVGISGGKDVGGDANKEEYNPCIKTLGYQFKEVNVLFGGQ